MKKKIAKKRAAALWNMGNIREKQKPKYVSKCISSCLQGIRMRRSTKEEQKTDVWSDKKKIQESEKKIHCSFLNFVKKFNLKINCKKSSKSLQKVFDLIIHINLKKGLMSTSFFLFEKR